MADHAQRIDIWDGQWRPMVKVGCAGVESITFQSGYNSVDVNLEGGRVEHIWLGEGHTYRITPA